MIIAIFVIDLLGLPMDLFYLWGSTLPQTEVYPTANDRTVELVAYSSIIINTLIIAVVQGYIGVQSTYYIMQYGGLSYLFFFDNLAIDNTPWYLIALNVVKLIVNFYTIPSVFLVPNYVLLVP